MIWELLTKVTEPAGMTVPPNVTVVAPETKPLPLNVTNVPALPVVGEMLEITGAGTVYL